MTFRLPNLTQQPVTQLDFHQSMNHFKTMFPSIDEDVIETVLRANNGAVDSTIDQLLQISSENQNGNSKTSGVPSNPPSYSASMQSSSPYNITTNLNINSAPKEKIHKSTLKEMDLLSSQPQAAAQIQNNQLIDFDTVDAACKMTSSKFNPPLVGSLPDDFLRITSTSEKINQQSNQNHLARQSSSSGDHQINHQLLKKKMEENERQRLNSNVDDKEIAFLEDERIALMLQNQEFVEELKRNKEFMSALNASHDSNAQSFSDPEDFKERIRKMGKLSREKFAQLAGLFSRRKGSGLPSRDNLLLGDQYAQLENDYSDSEEYGQKKQVNKPH